jgi:toxin-antitoxin system PIN domain toxin
VILCDVNVLLHAMVEHSPHHQLCRRELEELRRSRRAIALSEVILAAVARIGTNPRVYEPSPTPEQVFEFIDGLKEHPEAQMIAPGPRHWTIFRDLVLGTGVCGADTTDAFLAATAIEHGCEWWTTDRDFARFPGLRWRYLL